MAAGVNETPAVLTALLTAGADLTARDEDGWTPLHWAARYTKTPAVLVVLLAAGADLTARTERGKTPLHGGGME